jgi:hypothetical protein
MDDQRHALATSHPGMTRYQLYRWLGGPQDWSGRVRKISSPSGFDSWTAQTMAISYPGLFMLDRYNLYSKSTYHFCRGLFIRYRPLGRQRNNIYKNRVLLLKISATVSLSIAKVFICCWESMNLFCHMKCYMKISYTLISGVCQILFNNSSHVGLKT